MWRLPCWRCRASGRRGHDECQLCGGSGYLTFDRCPHCEMTPKSLDLWNAYRMCQGGMGGMALLPSAGGLLDQTECFLAASDFIDLCRSLNRAEADKRKERLSSAKAKARARRDEKAY